MAKRVLIAGLSHETHTFVPGVTRLADCRVARGDALLAAEGDVSPLAGALAVARERGWDLVPAIDIYADPGPIVDDALVEHAWRAIAAAAVGETFDGVYLVLHGAMASQSLPDVEGELLRRIRLLPGLAHVPIGGVLDLHGNITPTMALPDTTLVAYRANPHTDAFDAAACGARLLDRLMTTGERALTVYAQPPLLLPPTATGTADEPMRSFEALARALEASHPELLAVNVFAGFAYADVPHAGVSFTATTVGDQAQAQATLDDLCVLAMHHKHAADPVGLPLDAVLDGLQRHGAGPVLLVEPADNIGGGAPGDNTAVLCGLLGRGIVNAGVIINDPVAVRTVVRLRPGERVSLALGGKSGAIGAEPLVIDAELVSTSDGTFTLEDEHSHQAIAGRVVQMGPCALVRSAGVMVLLTSHPTAPFDLAQWRSQGIDPEQLFAIGVKAAVAHRQAYTPIARASVLLDTPGPCAANLRRLPYRHVRRPIYPLDEL